MQAFYPKPACIPTQFSPEQRHHLHHPAVDREMFSMEFIQVVQHYIQDISRGNLYSLNLQDHPRTLLLGTAAKRTASFSLITRVVSETESCDLRSSKMQLLVQIGMMWYPLCHQPYR